MRRTLCIFTLAAILAVNSRGADGAGDAFLASLLKPGTTCVITVPRGTLAIERGGAGAAGVWRSTPPPPSEPAVERRRITVLAVGSGGWLRVEYERKAGSDAAASEKRQLWLNFAHVSTISEIAGTPEDKPN